MPWMALVALLAALAPRLASARPAVGTQAPFERWSVHTYEDPAVGASAAAAADPFPKMGVRRALVYALTICGQQPKRDGKPLQAVGFKPVLYGGWSSVARTFDYCSSGKLRMDSQNGAFVDLDLGCDLGPYWANNCTNEDAFMAILFTYEKKARSVSAAMGLTGFRWHIFLVPRHKCSWAGGAWDDWGHFSADADLSTVIHELGHTLHLTHSRSIPRTTDPAVMEFYGGTATSPMNLEYGDWSSQMGTSISAPGCYNLPQQRWLKWHFPQTFDKDSLTPGTWLALTAPDTFADAKAGFRIVPNWMTPAPSDSVYVSWAPALGSNAGLYPPFRNRVYVHLFNDGASDDRDMNTNSVMVARLAPGQRWTSAQLGAGWRGDLVVHFHYYAGPVDKLLAAISICRKGGTQTCTVGDDANTHIYSFEMDSAAGKYVASRGVDWQLTPVAGQWARYYRVSSPEACGEACVYLPSCTYFTYLLKGNYGALGMNQSENCRLLPSTAKRGAAQVANVVSGNAARGGVARPNLPRLASLVLSLDGANVTAADYAARRWRDISGNGNHLQLRNVGRATAFGGVLSFRGTADSYAVAASLAPGSIPGVTWSGVVWYRDEGSGLQQPQVLMSLNRYGGPSSNFVNEFVWQTDKFWEYGAGDSVPEYVPALPSTQPRCWHMLAVTKNGGGGSLTYYWQGNRIGSWPVEDHITWGSLRFVMGRDDLDDSMFLKGSVGVALMWNVELTAAEVKSVYKRYSARFASSLCRAAP